MASNDKVFIRAAERPSLRAELGTQRFIDRGDWLELESTEALDSSSNHATALSQKLGVITVYWSIHTVVDQIWMQAFRQGDVVRTLRYSADEGWAENWGARLPFENRKELAKWTKRKRLLASPDGYDVLEAFLGRETPQEGVEPLRVADANLITALPASVVADAVAVAARRGLEPAVVVAAAWELGKEAAFQALSQQHRHLDLTSARPGPMRLPEGFLTKAFKVPLALTQCPRCHLPMHEGVHSGIRGCSRCHARFYGGLRADPTLECSVRLAEAALGELYELRILLDATNVTLLTVAYVSARPQLG
jgi:hypothetical protein